MLENNKDVKYKKFDFRNPEIYNRWKVLADLNAKAAIRRYIAEKMKPKIEVSTAVKKGFHP